MSCTTTIRTARDSDLLDLASLLEELFYIEEDFTVDRDRQLRGLDLMLHNPQGRVLVAEADGTVVGMCTGQLLISTSEGGPAVMVEDVVVRRGWRNKGVGAELMTAITQWAQEQGATRLQLLADRNNTPAFAFYNRLGWKHTRLVCMRSMLES
ncbi:GNAT family N-acetyltransferase [Desulfovibrio subterraneus]|uniref:N-acetyltransferase n=1 Tax=Desulfovibrio subterraneus TaxID=2718620 RepID=A0A7J0BN72_9BACT|nr:GNAT family N-acetyltransferase [Desulfovibrio subterraneus]GFM35197.1 N-acetyltransferase [Desulfovibrio subterraneus]